METPNSSEKAFLQNLKDDENGFKLLVENIKDYAIFMVNPDGYIMSWNKGAEQIKGYSEEEVLGKHISIFYTEDEIKREVPWHFLELAKKNGRYENEGWRVKKDGTTFWANVVLTALYSQSGAIKGFAKITKDITDKKLAEDFVKKSNERFFTIFNLSPEAKSIANISDGRFIHMNAAFENLFQIPHGEGIGKTSIELNIMTPEDRTELVRKIKEEGLRKGELILRTIKGSTIDVLGHTELIELDGKNCFLSTFIDITEQKKAEDSLRKSNERFLKIFDLSPEAKVISSVKNGQFLFVNKAFTKLFGISVEDAVGKTAVELNMLSKEERETLSGNIKEGIIEGEEIKLRAATGEVKNILFNSAIAELDGEECFFTSYLDITERKKIEEEVANLNEELEKHITQLESVNKELESFSYSVSHDLRAPLRAIDGFSRVLVEDYFDKLDEEGKALLQRIISNAQRMGRLIDDLLNFSRIGRKELQKSPVDMNNIIDMVVAELANETAERKISFTIQPLQTSMADINLLRHVWENLIHNAVKYTNKKEYAIIEIGNYDEGNFTVYYIKDNGAGFDMKYADKLFGVFQRLHKEKDFEGTGVGLAIIHRIITKHDGKVWGEGETDKGATFYFTLPKIKQ